MKNTISKMLLFCSVVVCGVVLGTSLSFASNDVVKNKWVAINNQPVTVGPENIEYSIYGCGEIKTYEIIRFENPNNEESINKVNQFLDDLVPNIKDAIERPEGLYYAQYEGYVYSVFYQNERVIVVKEFSHGATGVGRPWCESIYYVFDKNTGNRLTLEDISNDVDTLKIYIFFKSTDNDDGYYSNWWEICNFYTQFFYGGEDLRQLGFNGRTLQGMWGIYEDGIVVSMTGMAGPDFTLKYKLDEMKHFPGLEQNIKEEYFC